MKEKLLAGKDLFLFDLDGVFYRGKESRVKIGGTAAVAEIRKRGKRLCILTNNSTDTTETVMKRLQEAGIAVEEGEVMTSASLTSDYLLQRHGTVDYFLVGERGLEKEMERKGHRRTLTEDADFVVVGLDRSLTYEKLDRAAAAVRNGARIVATHAARLYMYRDGPAVATGPIVRALEYATRSRATVIGKPSPLMFKIALDKFNCPSGRAVMIGDQVETDLMGAKRAGLDYILVTSGVDKEPGNTTPLAVLPNVDSIVRLI